MTVGVKRDAYVRVPQALLYHLGVDRGLQRQDRPGVQESPLGRLASGGPVLAEEDQRGRGVLGPLELGTRR